MAVGGTNSPRPRLHEGLEFLGRDNTKIMCQFGMRVIMKRWGMLKVRFGSLDFIFAQSCSC